MSHSFIQVDMRRIVSVSSLAEASPGDIVIDCCRGGIMSFEGIGLVTSIDKLKNSATIFALQPTAGTCEFISINFVLINDT